MLALYEYAGVKFTLAYVRMLYTNVVGKGLRFS